MDAAIDIFKHTYNKIKENFISLSSDDTKAIDLHVA